MEYYPSSYGEGLKMVGKGLGLTLLGAGAVYTGEAYLPRDVFGTIGILFFVLLMALPPLLELIREQ